MSNLKSLVHIIKGWRSVKNVWRPKKKGRGQSVKAESRARGEGPRNSKHEMTAAIIAIRSAQSRFEESVSSQMEGILASVHQWTWSLREDLSSEIQRTKMLVDFTWREFKMQLADIGNRAWRWSIPNTATCVCVCRARVPMRPWSSGAKYNGT